MTKIAVAIIKMDIENWKQYPLNFHVGKNQVNYVSLGNLSFTLKFSKQQVFIECYVTINMECE